MRQWLRAAALRLHRHYAGPGAEQTHGSMGYPLWRAARFLFHRVSRQPDVQIMLDAEPRLSGFAAITGWVVSRTTTIRSVEAWLGDQLIHSGPPTEWRDDVRERFSRYRFHGPMGFRIAPEPKTIPEGIYPLVFHAVDHRGNTCELRTKIEIADYRMADRGEVPAHLRGSNREYQLVPVPQSQTVADGPLISVVMPVHRPNLEHLQEAAASVRHQQYQQWELCICDDGSAQPTLTQWLRELTNTDARIRVLQHTTNRGIAAATNTAVGMGQGEYVAFMDQDDRLAPHALAEVTRAAHLRPFDILYSDEDRIDAHGCRFEPFFKPDWSPDLLRSMMYLAHLCVYRRSFLAKVGLCRSEFDGAQDWELALRATAQTQRIVHVPMILYHWRLGGSSAGAAFNRVCHERGRRAIAESLVRANEPADVADGPNGCTFHVRYRHSERPLVSILIPTRDNVQLLKRCLRSIRKQTDYLNYEIIIIDNGSKQRDTLRFLNRCRERVLRLDMPFNHSRLNNRAAQEARGDLLLLLNDDTEVINRDWLTALVEQAQRPSVGAVGAWLFHPDGRTQHAGIVLGGDAVAVNLHSGITRDGLDRGTVRLLRNASGVTAACMMIRKELYERMGGLDEDALPTSFNDVDLCLRLRQAGYAIVCTPLARLYHHESASRTIGDDEPFRQIMRERGRDSLDVDPFWNPNLCRAGTGFAFHRPAEATPSPAAWVARPGPA